MMKLLSATPSPYARKVRIALAEKGLQFELVTEVPWNADTTTPKFNPLEKVPVLILEDGTTVYESRHILEYLEVKFPHPPMFPMAPDDFLAAKRLEVLADGICDAAVLVIFERRRPQDRRSDHPSGILYRGSSRSTPRWSRNPGYRNLGLCTVPDLSDRRYIARPAVSNERLSVRGRRITPSSPCAACRWGSP